MVCVRTGCFLALCGFAEGLVHDTTLTQRGKSQAQQQTSAKVDTMREASSDGSAFSGSSNTTLLRSLDFSHRLRVCNAYTSTNEVEVFLGSLRLTDQPMPYKTCTEFTAQLQAGDKLQFKVGTAGVGTFAVNELPSNDAVLLLVIYRHDALSDIVAFESHIFANLINAQIAVLDTYKGKKSARPRIQDVQNAKTSRDEELRYDSVVAVNPGLYEVVLPHEAIEQKNVTKQELVALNRESYLVLRVGMDSDDTYPEDLLVFPHSNKALIGTAFSRIVSWQVLFVPMVVASYFASYL